ncbi:unnamed protein product [Cylicocyclus nassatus]|uniref:Uncharacterized protein n=1 Tax=Cylicocyclus nassatus TaxID=53992 RepID=A0AA36GDL1_CYLNA|nr:unnamed protein product [Cylicocyclus nassatus]
MCASLVRIDSRVDFPIRFIKKMDPPLHSTATTVPANNFSLIARRLLLNKESLPAEELNNLVREEYACRDAD